MPSVTRLRDVVTITRGYAQELPGREIPKIPASFTFSFSSKNNVFPDQLLRQIDKELGDEIGNVR